MSVDATSKRQASYRSLLVQQHDSAGARWREVNGLRLVKDFGESADDRTSLLSRLALIDLSPLPRVGIKGRQTAAWLAAHGFGAHLNNNRGRLHEDGKLAVRLAANELLVLDCPARPVLQIDNALFHAGRECYGVRRQDSHYWFAVAGFEAPAMLAKLCGVDLRPEHFDVLQVGQTQLARTSAVVVRHRIGQINAYYILGDSSYTVYMWGVIRDAIREYNGGLLGHAVLLS